MQGENDFQNRKEIKRHRSDRRRQMKRAEIIKKLRIAAHAIPADSFRRLNRIDDLFRPFFDQITLRSPAFENELRLAVKKFVQAVQTPKQRPEQKQNRNQIDLAVNRVNNFFRNRHFRVGSSD